MDAQEPVVVAEACTVLPVIHRAGVMPDAARALRRVRLFLQVARSSGPGDIARAQAHEDADGYAGNWNVVALAVCANTPRGYEVLMAPSPQRLSEPEKLASATCPANKQLLGAGGAISNVAPGHVSLQVVYPFNNLRPGRVQAFAVENTPTSVNWDFIVAAAICAD